MKNNSIIYIPSHKSNDYKLQTVQLNIKTQEEVYKTVFHFVVNIKKFNFFINIFY
jgi:hypothetical protein